MTFKKSILTSACAFAFVGMTGVASANPLAKPMLGAVPETRTTMPRVPVRVAPIVRPASAPVQQQVSIETDNIDQATQQLFENLPSTIAPTGILIERDAADLVTIAASLDGQASAPAISYPEFGALRTQLGIDQGLVTAQSLRQASLQANADNAIVPISLMLLNYDTFGAAPANKVVLGADSKLSLKTPVQDATETKLLFAVSIERRSISHLNNSFVIPSGLFVSNYLQASDLTRITIALENETPKTVRFDQPFQLSQKFANATEITANVTVDVGRQQLHASARTPYSAPTAQQIATMQQSQLVTHESIRTQHAASRSNPNLFNNPCDILCFRLLGVAQQVPFVTPHGDTDSDKGVVYPMIYPRQSIFDTLLGDTIVLVDGFDNQGDRDHAYLYNDYKEAIAEYHELGYDVIVLDYKDGQNWIQNNALAVREFLVNELPRWKKRRADTKTVVMGRSMGSPLLRYALRSAEIAGEDHQVDLYLSHDGPHYGSSVPAGALHLLDWANVGGILNWLGPIKASKTPGAEQLLRRVPDENDRLINPQEFLTWLAEVNAADFGLPKNARNVALANGSGTGSLQTGSERWTDLGNTNPNYGLMRVNAPLVTLLGWVPVVGNFIADLKIDVNTNHRGTVFRAEKKRTMLGFITITTVTTRTVGDEANFVDIAPGGNLDKFSFGLLSNESLLGKVNHVPTNSSLMYKGMDDIFDIPAFDADLLVNTPFDEVFFDQCNSTHTEFTENLQGVVKQELLALKTGVAPALIQRPQQRCGDKETENLCFLPARLHDAQGNSKLSIVRHDGEYCQVAPVPEGRTGFAHNDGLYLETAVSCPAGSFVTATGCGFTRLPADHLYAYTDNSDLIIIAQSEANTYCPDNTRFKARAGMMLRCELQMPTGFNGRDLRLDGAGNFEYKIDLQELCPEGRKFQAIQGAKVCVVGTIPENTRGLIHNGHFVYDEFTGR